MRRILIATSIPFWRQRRGSDQRIASLVRSLRAHEWDIDIFYISNASPTDESIVDREFGASLHSRGQSLPADYYVADPPLSRFRVEGIRVDYQNLLHSLRPCAALIEYIELAYLIDGLDRGLRDETLFAIDTHDVMHLRFERFRRAGEPHWVSIDRDEEAGVLRDFDVVAAIQEADATELRAMAPRSNVVTARHAPALPWRQSNLNRRDTVRFGFIGVCNAPNLAAARFLLKKVWPHVTTSAVSPPRLTLAGPVCDGVREMAAGRPNVALLGEIESVNVFYDSIDVLLNPVTFGGGLKIKNVEALAHGIPLVTTSVGAEGLGGEPGDSYLIAQDAGDWITHCNSLAGESHERLRVGDSGRRLALARFHPETAYTELHDALTSPVVHREVAV
jgi:glycosyltransferase involved in cell wall biosynthesis